jgi:hypothetical protein
MIIHHSLSNNLWDQDRTLLNISNKEAAREFANVLLEGIVVKDEKRARARRSLAKVKASTSKKKKK